MKNLQLNMCIACLPLGNLISPHPCVHLYRRVLDSFLLAPREVASQFILLGMLISRHVWCAITLYAIHATNFDQIFFPFLLLELEPTVESQRIHAGAANQDAALNKLPSISDVRYFLSSCEQYHNWWLGGSGKSTLCQKTLADFFFLLRRILKRDIT
jgi:hypothetical protein